MFARWMRPAPRPYLKNLTGVALSDEALLVALFFYNTALNVQTITSFILALHALTGCCGINNVGACVHALITTANMAPKTRRRGVHTPIGHRIFDDTCAATLPGLVCCN